MRAWKIPKDRCALGYWKMDGKVRFAVHDSNRVLSPNLIKYRCRSATIEPQWLRKAHEE